uniref:Actin-depolymerizing factor 5 n=1 Tax=Aegilops tauschii TaxID=37682 RepID=M8B2M5_AEGTA
MAMAYKMATEGMNIKEECKRWFTEMKWKKVHRFVVYKIDERTRAVLVDKVGGPGEGYEELVAALPGDDCRYAVFDFDFVSVDNCQKSKIFFIAWSPAASRIRAKILYATSKQGLRRVLEGVHYEEELREWQRINETSHLCVRRGNSTDADDAPTSFAIVLQQLFKMAFLHLCYAQPIAKFVRTRETLLQIFVDQLEHISAGVKRSSDIHHIYSSIEQITGSQ